MLQSYVADVEEEVAHVIGDEATRLTKVKLCSVLRSATIREQSRLTVAGRARRVFNICRLLDARTLRDVGTV